MPTFHHVNLGVRPEDADAEGDFLVDVLGYLRVPSQELPEGVGARWFRAADGTEVHLSADPDHRPAAMAHVAVHYGDGLAAVQARLDEAGLTYRAFQSEQFPPILLCQDPAGNRWELRGPLAAPQ